MNNASLGISIQKSICDYFNINIPIEAERQFFSNFSNEFEFSTLMKNIFNELKAKPIECLTYTHSKNSRRKIESSQFFIR